MSNVDSSPKVDTQQDRDYWLHRISHEWDVSHKLLSQGYLAIGWSSLADSGIEGVVDDSDRKRFKDTLLKLDYPFSRSEWGLWRFLVFRPNDYVVVPTPRKFSIYRIIGKPMPITKLPEFSDFQLEDGSSIVRNDAGLLLRTASDKIVDLGFVVKVEPIKENLSRNEYADNNLTSRMKIRQTNAELSNDLVGSIQRVIRADAPINLYAEIIENIAEKMLKVLKDQLTPDKFELLIRWYFRKMGASKAYIPGKNDPNKLDGADVDIIAEFESLKVIFYVQAKLHDDVTQDWAVKQISKFIDQRDPVHDENTAIPWVISTADDFSEKAFAMALENGVRLIVGSEFARMLIDAGITDINEAFE